MDREMYVLISHVSLNTVLVVVCSRFCFAHVLLLLVFPHSYGFYLMYGFSYQSRSRYFLARKNENPDWPPLWGSVRLHCVLVHGLLQVTRKIKLNLFVGCKSSGSVD